MSSGQAVRVGIVGLGFGARVVAPAFAETEGCEVVDVVSPRDEAAVTALCSREDVDLISIHSPPFLHLEHVRRVVDAGHAVACDKPFGRDASEARAMCELAQDAGVVNLINFEFRYDPMREALRRLVLEGAVGTPEHFEHSMFMALSRSPLRPHGWLFDAALGGGWIGAFGSHVIDFARWCFGDVVAAAAELRTSIEERPDAEGNPKRCTAEDGFVATLRTASDVTIVIDSSCAAPVSLAPRTVIIGSEAIIETEGDRRAVISHLDGRREELDPSPDGANVYLLPSQRWASMARDAVRDGEASPDAPTFADGLACARVMDLLRV
jgi:predicted dehydrogenase